MKRTLSLLCSIAAVTAASLLFAQSPQQATLRTPAGDRPVTYVVEAGQTYFAADEVVALLGGTITPDSNGFKVSINNETAAFGPDSRFGVIRDDLIEMPVSPVTIEGRPFVPWQFFSGLLSRAAAQEVAWDAGTRVLSIRPRQVTAVDAQVTVTNIEGVTKVVLTLSAPAEYAIAREGNSYVVRLRSAVRAPFTEKSFEDPHVSRVTVAGSDVTIHLAAADVVGDPYTLENPSRIVVDLRKGAAPAPGQVPQIAPRTAGRDLPGIRTIVIDPGHGGKEVGAIGPNGLMEKELTLTIARKLASAISSRLNTRVVLTREDDSLVSLDQRTAIANQYGADLFISVHMNAAVVKDARGSETYFLNVDATDEAARRAAETENASSSGAADDLSLILWDLAHQQYVQESSRLAQAIQEEMNGATGVQNRGVKQAPFKVLVGATMPAALVEIAFISNPEEEAKLQTEAFQTMIVDALTRAVQRYKNDFETRIGVIRPQAPAPAPEPAAPAAPAVRAPAGS